MRRLQAAADACKRMGCREYHEQMVQDELQYPNHKITDDILLWICSLSGRCVVLLQSTSNLDESPACFGGRNNCWGRLSLQNFPEMTIIYAITDYAQSKTFRLKKELKFLLLRRIHDHKGADKLNFQLLSIFTSRPEPGFPNPPQKAQSVQDGSGTDKNNALACFVSFIHEKNVTFLKCNLIGSYSCMCGTMRGIIQVQKLGVTNRSDFVEHQGTVIPQLKKPEDQSIVTEEWEYEAGKLYAWSQALSLEDIGQFPSTADA
ncbi:LOW QUALITY PROTEIN: uncharacterized protein CXorf58 homolog [Pluvialis apricaria]